MSEEGHFWKSELHLFSIQGQVIVPTNFLKVKEILIMFLIISSINDHVISNSSDTWHIKEDAVEFPLENILSNNGTHWKSGPLKPSNV